MEYTGGMGCFLSVLLFLLKIVKTALKAVWWVLKFLTLKLRLIFIILFGIAVGLIYWLWPAADIFGANIAWFYVGFALSLGLTIALIVFTILRRNRA